MTEKPDNVIRPTTFRGGERAASKRPRTPEEIRAAGAIPLSDARMDKAMGGVVHDAWGGKDGYIVQFPDGAQLPLDADELRKPLGEIREVKAHLEKLGEDRVKVFRIRADGRLIHQDERIFTKDMLGESIAESFAKERVFPELAEKTVGKRLKEMSGGDKAWAVMVALFLYSAIDNLRHSVDKNPHDPQGKREIHWNQLTWGAVNTMLAWLSGMQVFSALRGHPVH